MKSGFLKKLKALEYISCAKYRKAVKKHRRKLNKTRRASR